MAGIMPFEKFEKIMKALESYREKRSEIGKFFEDKLMEDSYCFVTFGSELEKIIMELLADEFDCWFTWGGSGTEDNDIEWWTYEAPDDKKITVEGKDISINSLKDFYNYLVSEKERKNNAK